MKTTTALLLSSLILAACGGSGGNKGQTKQLYVDSHRSPCTGMVQRLCLRVSTNNQNFTNYYTEIQGFNYQWGHSYQIVIEETQIDNPPADGSSVSRSLISINSDIEDGVGSEYTMENVDLLYATIRVENDQLLFLGKPITCAADIDCDYLLEMNDSGGMLNFTFKYLGEGEIELIGYD